MINKINDNLDFSASLSVYSERYMMFLVHARESGRERGEREGERERGGGG